MRKWMYFPIILLLGLSVHHVSAFEFYEKTEWLGVDDDPKFCLVEESLDPTFMENKNMFERVTKEAITNWETSLKQDSGNINAWDIDYEYVRVDDPQNPIYEKNCDVYIEFYDAIDDLGTTGLTFVMETLEAPVIYIAYLEFEWVETICDSTIYYCLNDTYFEMQFTGYIADEKRLVPTLTHEMGHTFGLGHFLTNDSLLLDAWDQGLKKPPSLMIEFEPMIGYSEITELDTQKIFSIYGTDGFGQSERTLPDWIKSNAEWWSQGLVSDEEYLNAIEYLITEGIIKI